MADLEYRIGGMDVIPNLLGFEGFCSDGASHKFVVEAVDNVVSIYVALGSNHIDIAKKFGMRGQNAGGGSCYLNGKSQLVLDNFSGDCNAIPREVAQVFTELMLPELKKLGVKVDGIGVNPMESIMKMESIMNPYWRKKGFSFQ